MEPFASGSAQSQKIYDEESELVSPAVCWFGQSWIRGSFFCLSFP